MRSNGEVTIHEGYLSRKEARARERNEATDAPEKARRPEITSSMQTYVDLLAMPPCAPPWSPTPVSRCA